MSAGETIHEADTGAKKAGNDVRMSLVPTEELLEVARHYGRGSSKYGDHNWRKGMPFSWHYDALQRHLLDYWGGEDIDTETGSEHLDAVIFHALGLKYGRKHHSQLDDRPMKVAEAPSLPVTVDRLTEVEKDWAWADPTGNWIYKVYNGVWHYAGHPDGEYHLETGWEPSSEKYRTPGPFTRVDS